MIRPVTTFERARDQAISALVAETLGAGHAMKFRALGSSMIPAIWPGDLLTIKPVGTSFPEIGEVVLTLNERGLQAHRVVERQETAPSTAIVTRGDAMTVCDPVAPTSAVLGLIVARNGRRLRAAPSQLVRSANRISGCAALRWLRLKLARSGFARSDTPRGLAHPR